MNVLVDTSVWSLSLRRKTKTPAQQALIEYFSKLLRNLQVVVIGPIRQEILSGISDEEKFETIRKNLSILPDYELSTSDYELAAAYYNKCRQHGLQGSHIDFLICATAVRHDFPILTLDHDFKLYKKHIDLVLIEDYV